MAAPDDITAATLEHHRDTHLSLARDYRNRAEQADIARDRAAVARWSGEADRLEALGADDDRQLRTLRDRQRHAAARALTARRPVTTDFIR